MVAEHGIMPLDLSDFSIAGLMLSAAFMGSLLRNFVKWPKKGTTKSKSVSEVVEEKERAKAMDRENGEVPSVPNYCNSGDP